jgi:hypothetical protein
MSYLIKRIYDKISQFGDGDTEFYTGDIERLCKKLEKMKRQRDYQIKSMALSWKGLHFHRIQENKDQEHIGWNNPEKSFAAEWKALGDSHLTTILSSDACGLKLKSNYKARVIANTLMQWLGSNVGMSFLKQSLTREGFEIVKIKNDDKSTIS